MTITFFIVIVSIIVCAIEVYSEIHIQNDGTMLERLFYLLSIKTLFIIFKLSCLISFIYILFDFELIKNTSHLAEITIINIYWENWYLYLVAPVIFALFIIFSNSRKLFRQLQSLNIENERINNFLANLKYLIIRAFSFALAFLIFKFVFKYMNKSHDYFISRKLYIFDWLMVDPGSIDNYDYGLYISLTLTIIIFFLFNNAFIKKNSDILRFREINFHYFKYLFISLILGLGLFFGLFSIFNGFHNLINTGISEWITKENVLGILPIRISSILIIYYLLTYIYSEVLHKNLRYFLLLGILPIRQIRNYHGRISFEKRETLFFSQISFYILNVGLAEFFFIMGFNSILLSVLNFSILFILDDFKIINDYSNGLRGVLRSHFLRISVFNFLMLVVAIMLLWSKEYYWILISYITLFCILFRYYFLNSSSITFTR